MVHCTCKMCHILSLYIILNAFALDIIWSIYSLYFDRCNEYCSAQKSRKLTALIRLGGKGHNNFLASKSLKHHNISQYHNPIGCTDSCGGTSLDISMSENLGKPSHQDRVRSRTCASRGNAFTSSKSCTTLCRSCRQILMPRAPANLQCIMWYVYVSGCLWID